LAYTQEELNSIEATEKHIGVVRDLLSDCIEDLRMRALGHDESKMRRPELDMFAEYTPKLATSTYGSDEYKGFLKEMGVALQHHYSENSHHPEHFANGVDGMTLLDLLEMICDWLAATKRHNDGDINKSIEINTKRFGLSDQLVSILKNTVSTLDM
jgi:hypothetical protein